MSAGLSRRRLSAAVLVGAGLLPALPLRAQDDDKAGPFAVRLHELSFIDPGRQRTIPARAYRPEGAVKPPVVLFSHGLGGSVLAGEDWGRHWASHGIASIHLQHAGSDREVFAGVSDRAAILRLLKPAITAENLLLRVGDMRFVAAALAARGAPADLLDVDAARIGAAGHSFGAVTVQALAGQRYASQPGTDLSDARFLAFLALSPSAPVAGDPAAAFAKVERPFFSITGTADRSAVYTDAEPANRLLPFRHMPPGGKYLLVFEGGEHAMFSGSSRRGAGAPAPARLVAATRATTTAFWKATLAGDDTARRWLAGPRPRSLLGPGDQWAAK